MHKSCSFVMIRDPCIQSFLHITFSLFWQSYYAERVQSKQRDKTVITIPSKPLTQLVEQEYLQSNSMIKHR